MLETECDHHSNFKIIDKKLVIDTSVKVSKNQSWDHQIWEFRKIDHVPLRLCILPKIVCYSQQIHTRVTTILDNEVTHLKNEFFFIIIIEKNVLV